MLSIFRHLGCTAAVAVQRAALCQLCGDSSDNGAQPASLNMGGQLTIKKEMRAAGISGHIRSWMLGTPPGL